MPSRSAIVLSSILALSCASGADSTTGPKEALDSAAGPGVDPACDAWLEASPHAPSETLCDNPVDRALDQIQQDGVRAVPLPSGRTSLIWIPDDWFTRSERSALVLIHGSVGCPEGIYGNARLVFGDEHALISLSFAQPDGTYLESESLQADLDATVAELEGACPMTDTTWMLYGLSRGGLRATQLGARDRMGPRRMSGVVVDSGTAPNRQLQGLSFAGARFLFWCGANDPDPVQEGRYTCEVMTDDVVPFLMDSGALIDDVLIGEDACHGMYEWDCSADCERCAGQAGIDSAGPHAEAVAAWLRQVAAGG